MIRTKGQDDVALAFLATPTDVFAVPGEAVERSRAEIKKAADTLRQRLAAEKDPKVRQDLEILILATDDQLQGSMLGEKMDHAREAARRAQCAGNLRQMFRGIAEIGTDVLRRGARSTGSILIDSMTVAGN